MNLYYLYIIAIIIIAILIVLFFFRANMQLVFRCRALESRLLELQRANEVLTDRSNHSPDETKQWTGSVNTRPLTSMPDRDELFQIILDNIPYCILVKDADHDFRHILWNRELERHTGLSEEDMLNKTDFEIEPWPGFGAFIRELDEEALRKGSIDHETLCDTLTGRSIYYQTKKRAIKTSSGRTLIIDMCRDMTREMELRNSNAEIIEKQQRLIERYNAIYDCISFMTLQNGWDKVFNYIIARFGEVENAQRCYVYFIDKRDPEAFSHVCEWDGKESRPIPEELKTVPFNVMPRTKQILLKDRQIALVNTSELADDSVFKEWVIKEQVGFVIFAPIMYNDQIVGLVGFDYRELQKPCAETSSHVVHGAVKLIGYVYSRQVVEQNGIIS